MANLEARPPDFNAMARGLDIFKTEIQHCANLPAIQDGRAITEALQELTREFTALRRDVAALRREVGETGQSMAAERSNSVTRLLNSRVQFGDHALQPLRGLDNQPIEDFPETPNAIRNLGVAEARRILQRLGEDARGRNPQGRLLAYAGIINERKDISQ